MRRPRKIRLFPHNFKQVTINPGSRGNLLTEMTQRNHCAASVCVKIKRKCIGKVVIKRLSVHVDKTNIKQSAVNIYTILFREQLFSTFITIYNTTRTTGKLLHSPYQVSHPHPMLLRTRTLSQCLNIQVSFPVHNFSGSNITSHCIQTVTHS